MGGGFHAWGRHLPRPPWEASTFPQTPLISHVLENAGVWWGGWEGVGRGGWGAKCGAAPVRAGRVLYRW